MLEVSNTQRPEIVVDWESFSEIERLLLGEIERLMSLPSRNTPLVKKAIKRRKEALHQLLEWKDFLLHPEYYNDDRGERMKRLLDRMTTFDKRERVKRIELYVVKYRTLPPYALGVRIKSEYVRKENKIRITAEYGLNDSNTISFYVD